MSTSRILHYQLWFRGYPIPNHSLFGGCGGQHFGVHSGGKNAIDADNNQLLFSQFGGSWHYYFGLFCATGGPKLPHIRGPVGVGISWVHLDDLFTGKEYSLTVILSGARAAEGRQSEFFLIGGISIWLCLVKKIGGISIILELVTSEAVRGHSTS